MSGSTRCVACHSAIMNVEKSLLFDRNNHVELSSSSFFPSVSPNANQNVSSSINVPATVYDRDRGLRTVNLAVGPPKIPPNMRSHLIFSPSRLASFVVPAVLPLHTFRIPKSLQASHKLQSFGRCNCHSSNPSMVASKLQHRHDHIVTFNLNRI